MTAGRKPIYVETVIRTDMDRLWLHTQHPELHRQWDVRFTDIHYHPRQKEDGTQTFTYRTQIGFGLRISGTGETRTKISAIRNERLSTLSFGSEQPQSLISRGAGYWKYTRLHEFDEEGEPPTIRFATRYDYRTRFGWAGLLFDRWLFRPVFGYATAWSFDLLRIWLEAGIPPRILIRQAVVHYACAAALAGLWIGQGLLPKLLFPGTGELAVMQAAGWIPGGWGPALLALLGILEIAVGTVSPFLHRSRVYYRLQALLLLLLAVSGAAGNPALLASPYNPAALAAAMIVLCGAAHVTSRELPQAGRCRRKPGARGGGRA
ncbi:DoxX-like family protein [Paenibacillus glycinis]|uniref:DoxX family protein n=1 Tax=Paenibacillus glycinis TaxID=2697035 RepID=A0ABW9XLB6_9BACL|nr:DoxX-like family protein [Paenibacillus glycinis]NBD23390.1 hypothetical protein [Paenibacillus glycinis]